MTSRILNLLITVSILFSCSNNDIEVSETEISNTFISDTDYSDMANWAYHPNKSGTLIDSYNLDIAVIDEKL